MMDNPSAPPRKMSTTAWAAIFALAAGWFWMATLRGDFGPVQNIMHFYDLGSVLHDPSSLVHGIRSAQNLEVMLFGAVSILVLLSPLAAHHLRNRSGWLLYALPLVFMLICGIALYVKTSQPYFDEGASYGTVHSFLAHMSNTVVTHVSDTLSRHISIGAGGYISLLASLYLTFLGIRGFAAKGTVAESAVH